MAVQQDSAEHERQWEAHAWLRTNTLAELTECNELCLELLDQQCRAATANSIPPLMRDVGHILRRMDPDARRRAAVCPFLLFDGGFADQLRWSWVTGNSVRDTRAPEQPFFTVGDMRDISRRIFTFAWQLARYQSAAALALLGMTPHCARLISVCTIHQIKDIACNHPEWVQPRWARKSSFWRGLLASCNTGDAAAMEVMRLRGVQLLASERRGLTAP